MNFKLSYLSAALLLLSACSTLPSSGPTGGQITDTALEAQVDGASIDIVPVVSIADVPPVAEPIDWQLPDYDPPPSDMIGPGDVLSVTVFEAGVACLAVAASRQMEPGGSTLQYELKRSLHGASTTTG